MDGSDIWLFSVPPGKSKDITVKEARFIPSTYFPVLRALSSYHFTHLDTDSVIMKSININSWSSSVDIVTGHELDGRDLIPDRGNFFCPR
jgi:hypothetical protein